MSARYRALSQFSKDDARVQYLRIIRSLPYGNSIFFTVKVRGLAGLACGGVWEAAPLAGAACPMPTPILTHAAGPRPASRPRSASRTPSACCRPS